MCRVCSAFVDTRRLKASYTVCLRDQCGMMTESASCYQGLIRLPMAQARS